jgi:LPXTG-motif cell wall-anchored protein
MTTFLPQNQYLALVVGLTAASSSAALLFRKRGQ